MQWVSTKFGFVSSFVDHNIEEALDRPDRDRAPARDVDYTLAAGTTVCIYCGGDTCKFGSLPCCDPQCAT